MDPTPRKKTPLYARLRSGSEGLNRLQLSLLNSGLLPGGEQNRAETLIPKKPLESTKFNKHVELLRKYEVLARTEFQAASRGESHSTRHAAKEVNDIKNVNKKLVPYDYNRVVLEAIPGVPDSDYINASFIDGSLKPNAYIAAQGPTENTMGDFWRMVWDQKSYIIVMLTKVFDMIRVMCDQYWPYDAQHPEVYGDIEVHLAAERAQASAWFRTFRVKRGEEEREIYHFHYTQWPIHACPFPTMLLDFRRQIRMRMKLLPDCGPIIVHCSDGCGRTGTYLCIDANLELLEEDNMVDVFGYTRRLRQARKGMVESVEHYKFIYEFLSEVMLCGVTWFPVSELSHQIKLKSQKSSITRQNEYQREYMKICQLAPEYSIGDCAGGHRIENRDKNRDIATVPPDMFRPYLTTFQSNEHTDYVNAIFVDGYLRSKEFIVTEWPVARTVSDFWSLVYDYDCNSIVVLCNPTPSAAYPTFWPSEKEKKRKYGRVFTVELVSNHTYQNINTWIFNIAKKVVSLQELMAGVKADTKTTQLFQITCWPSGHKVPTSTNALVELMNMTERWRQRTTFGPVAVVSPNGRSRVGVFCAANYAIEQIQEHGEVDIVGAGKTTKRYRPMLIENVTEYKYCYDLVQHYVSNYMHKE